ncbi:sigma-70 family RNA polymerase sigma factor [Tenacibaculum finnmarkense genomovar finnmarkense]|uniref:Sigma-70 family RNA polymerase sigma factor n=1 Tax=Tenacibaculum finnmarkense genomovar finnmarkense TaxID=1458503 RepID=A0AAP1WG41_9FLAO|nr:sigma-70 family RNA polymerase sigma factor [Tenacibaculum finnmarkense]ALU75009.1 RNA polymerase subunit sigma [Tenacibaculum dicentrarchi]MBE7652586.1 sigma-70 family RNA polymerase sigma factor [Tenacibaculum finnmarkense genomovar finnmarkense]MBE7661323.1 sigma-70 family RNA polymerase sigma factor [Tenacibaculum finnmarkense genomovar finnmarkense]MBE7692684.1 sigma-70 family RNA polymerase sigma factor [Tenacibaculum finnmarkense genomovar finnmarkense]MBE7694885.1 sigma-70 family RN
MKKLSDEILWKSLKEGDLIAFEALFKNHYEPLFKYGLKISGNKIITEDSLQDFFMYVYEHRENLSDLTKIAPYLFVSYRRFLIKVLQKNQKNKLVRDINQLIVDIHFTPEEFLTHQEATVFRNKNLTASLNKLSKKQREVLYLKYNCNLKTPEIAEIMDINYQSVLNHIHKAIKRLREDVLILQLFNA